MDGNAGLPHRFLGHERSGCSTEAWQKVGDVTVSGCRLVELDEEGPEDTEQEARQRQECRPDRQSPE